MRALACLLVLLGAGLAALPAQAAPAAPARVGPLATLEATASCAPPCGYVAPLIDLVFEGKKNCGGASVDLSLCYAVPDEGSPFAVQGVLRYYWKMSEDGTYPSDPANPVQITFGKAANAPQWLQFQVEPASFTIDQQAFLDPANTKTTQDTTPPTVYFWFERPITVTFTRHGDPQGGDLDRIQSKDGIAELYVKAKATDSGSYIKGGFGGETFRFDASRFAASASQTSASGSAKSSPSAFLGVVGALAGAILVARRRL